MKKITMDDINNVYKQCGLSIEASPTGTKEPIKTVLNSNLNANYDFMYKGKSNPVWSNNVKN